MICYIEIRIKLINLEYKAIVYRIMEDYLNSIQDIV